MIWMILVFASLLSVAGQLCQKQATGFVAIKKRRKHIVLWLGLALACLGLAMVLWLLVLQSVPVGIAYPMLSLNFVWVTLAAVKLWHEPVSLRHWCGVAFIIGGIVIWEYGVMGLMWGLFSVMIASAAQLSLGYAASHLPSMTRWRDFIAAFLLLIPVLRFCWSDCLVI